MPKPSNDNNSKRKSHVTRDLKKGLKPKRGNGVKARESFERRLHIAEHHPVQALVEAKRHIALAEKGFRWDQYETMSIAVRAASGLKSSVAEWEKLKSLPFWLKEPRKPKGPQADADVLRWELIYVFQARTELKKKRVFEYLNVLKSRLDDLDPASLPAFLEANGGIEGLKRRDKESRGKSEGRIGDIKEVDADDKKQEENDDNEDDDESSESEDTEENNSKEDDQPFGSKKTVLRARPKSVAAVAAHKSISEPGKASKLWRTDLPKVPTSVQGPLLIVEITQEQMDRAFSKPLCEEFSIVAKRLAEVHGFKRVVTERVRSIKNPSNEG